MSGLLWFFIATRNLLFERFNFFISLCENDLWNFLLKIDYIILSSKIYKYSSANRPKY